MVDKKWNWKNDFVCVTWATVTDEKEVSTGKRRRNGRERKGILIIHLLLNYLVMYFGPNLLRLFFFFFIRNYFYSNIGMII